MTMSSDGNNDIRYGDNASYIMVRRRSQDSNGQLQVKPTGGPTNQGALVERNVQTCSTIPVPELLGNPQLQLAPTQVRIEGVDGQWSLPPTGSGSLPPGSVEEGGNMQSSYPHETTGPDDGAGQSVSHDSGSSYSGSSESKSSSSELSSEADVNGFTQAEGGQSHDSYGRDVNHNSVADSSPPPNHEDYYENQQDAGYGPNTYLSYGVNGAAPYPYEGYPPDVSYLPLYGYPNPGYPNPGYPNPGYPNPGYPNPGYPNPGYPNPGYPNPQAMILPYLQPLYGVNEAPFPPTTYPPTGIQTPSFPPQQGVRLPTDPAQPPIGSAGQGGVELGPGNASPVATPPDEDGQGKAQPKGWGSWLSDIPLGAFKERFVKPVYTKFSKFLGETRESCQDWYSEVANRPVKDVLFIHSKKVLEIESEHKRVVKEPRDLGKVREYLAESMETVDHAIQYNRKVARRHMVLSALDKLFSGRRPRYEVASELFQEWSILAGDRNRYEALKKDLRSEAKEINLKLNESKSET